MPGAPGGDEGSVELQYITNPYFGNKSSTTKLATTSTGVTVTGTVVASAFSGDGSNLTGISASATADTGGAIFQNSQTISADHTIPVGSNGMSAGPVSVMVVLTQ